MLSRLLLTVATGLTIYGLWVALHAPPEAHKLDNGAQVVWGDCWFDQPLFSRPVHCGHLFTAPEPGEMPEQFSLPVVYVPAFVWHRTQSPILYLAGGPGGATELDGEGVAAWLDWLDWVDWPADTIFFDQRGVGLSEPSLSCPETLQSYRELLSSRLSSKEKYLQVRMAGEACLARLQREGWNLQRFTTALNAVDARNLIDSLDLGDWQIYGISYGTRIAMQLMREYSSGLKAVVLDSVYPPAQHAEENDAWLLDRSLRLFERSCELLPDCEFSPERLEADLKHVFQQLEVAPLQLTLQDPETDLPLKVLFSRDDLAWLIFESQYVWSNIVLLPAAISALAEERVTPEMKQLMQESVDNVLDDSLSEAVFASVDCADNGDFSESQANLALEQYPRVASIKQYDWQFSACRYWDVDSLADDFRGPVESSVPTLLLAGEFDPVTPPEWAEKSAQYLPESYLFIAPGIGHGVMDSDTCSQALVREFLAHPTKPKVPDCLQYW